MISQDYNQVLMFPKLLNSTKHEFIVHYQDKSLHSLSSTMKILIYCLCFMKLSLCIQLIEGVPNNNDVDVKDVNSDFPQSGPPPTNIFNVLNGCSCKRVLLSSLGPAATYLPYVMGTYTL